MKRNRIVYFIVAAIFIAAGYVIRIMNFHLSMEGSFVFISIGVYFLLAVFFRKAAAWVLVILDFALMGGLQGLSKLNFQWYNLFYKSELGQIIIGGPLSLRIALYILMGIFLGAVLEILFRQYNRIGLGD